MKIKIIFTQGEAVILILLSIKSDVVQTTDAVPVPNHSHCELTGSVCILFHQTNLVILLKTYHITLVILLVKTPNQHLIIFNSSFHIALNKNVDI